jgi:accessory gene regulator B
VDTVIERILEQLELRNIVKKEELEVYRFGLECVLLKMVHIGSYMLVALYCGELLSLLVSAAALIPLRKKVGGYHEKTRYSCYFFSCSIVILLCLVNKFLTVNTIGILGLIIAETVILIFSPIENENRKLEYDEKNIFRRQAREVLIVINCIIICVHLINRHVYLACWLQNGVIFAGALLLLEICKRSICSSRA